MLIFSSFFIAEFPRQNESHRDRSRPRWIRSFSLPLLDHLTHFLPWKYWRFPREPSLSLLRLGLDATQFGLISSRLFLPLPLFASSSSLPSAASSPCSSESSSSSQYLLSSIDLILTTQRSQTGVESPPPPPRLGTFPSPTNPTWNRLQEPRRRRTTTILTLPESERVEMERLSSSVPRGASSRTRETRKNRL